MKSPKVSIIILNWNGLNDTVECLESLDKVTYPDYQVIVVDNGSTGGDARTLRERFGDYVHIIENDKNYGYTGGVNIGIKYALNNLAADYILLLNNDTIVDPEFLTKMVELAESDNSIGIVGAGVYDLANAQKGIIAKIRMFETRISFIGIMNFLMALFGE